MNGQSGVPSTSTKESPQASFDDVRASGGDPYVLELLRQLNIHFPICSSSVLDAINLGVDNFVHVSARVMSAIKHCFPDLQMDTLARWYAEFTVEQNRFQRQYDKTGKYPCANQKDANDAVYQNTSSMEIYMASMLVTQFFWPHHLQILHFYTSSFVGPFAANVKNVLEMAPGHGLLGREFLDSSPNATLLGIDISPFAIEMSRRMMTMPPAIERVSYQIQDALAFKPTGAFDIVIAGEVLEHLDRPDLLLLKVAECLADDGKAFITAAITAAQMDHVTEFCSPDEVKSLIHSAGLIIESEFVAQPIRTRPGSTRIPRVMATVVRKS
jgi:2-polyprenyl-3-methyl-5-hydroxy-6-metoxy-1,4-benzoquinol methylase